MIKDIVQKKWRGWLEAKLFESASKVIDRFQPVIIGVTGSTGKTTTKEAIYHVLSKKNHVRQTIGNMNNELGVPLTILGKDKPVGVSQWVKMVSGLASYVKKIDDYPAYIVLELAADRKGDIEKLCKLVKPVVGVVTNVGEAHLEYFGSRKKIMVEKRSLIESLPKNGLAILNADDDLVMKMKTKTKARVVACGLGKNAQVRAENIKMSLDGTVFKLIYNGSVVPIRIKPVGYGNVRACLCAVAVGLDMGMDLLDIKDALESWNPVNGRMRLVDGLNNTVILDDSYNASQSSVANALDSFRKIEIPRRKVAIMGSMWEIGKNEREIHVEVGKMLGQYFDQVIFVEKHASWLEKGAIKAGKDRSNIFVFANTDELLKNIDGLLRKDDFIYVKGSQSKNRLEKVVKKLMLNSKEAEKILVRQSKEWQLK